MDYRNLITLIDGRQSGHQSSDTRQEARGQEVAGSEAPNNFIRVKEEKNTIYTYLYIYVYSVFFLRSSYVAHGRPKYMEKYEMRGKVSGRE